MQASTAAAPKIARLTGTASVLMLAPACCMASASSASEVNYSHWGINAITVVATAVVVCACALLHYEALSFLSRWLGRRGGQRRPRVLLAIFGMLSAHIVEIWIFGLAYATLLLFPDFGTTSGIDSNTLDQIYLSAMTFTTVGAPGATLVGPIRFLNGTEALTGLVLITWSASFTFLEMERFWRDR